MKKGIALLTTMAILVSLVAMLGGLSLTSGAAYTPKRTITFTVSEGIQQSCLMLEDAYKVAAGKTVTISGYYKVDSITGDGFNVVGTQATTTATDGWQTFSIEYTVPTSGQWKDFGFWQASGKFALADITFTDSNGDVLYDMATDTSLIAGTYNYGKSKGYDKLSLWYVMGAYGTVADTASCEVVIDPVYTAPDAPAYTPKRVMSYTAGGTQIEGKMIITNSGDKLGANRDVVVKGYVKVENYVAKNNSDHNVQVGAGGGATGGLSITQNCDWTPFTINYTTSNGNWLKFGFWYAQGTMSIADLTIEENGVVIYDMATDADLVAGTYDAAKQPAQLGMWYVGYYGEKSEISATIDPVYVAPEVPTPTYTPKRVMSYTAGGTQIEGKMIITNSGDKLGANRDVVVKGYVKVENYVAKNNSDHNVQVGAGGGATGGLSITQNCDWTPFTINYTTSNGNWLKFGFWYAQGTMSIADLTIEENGVVIYDMAADTDLVEGTYDAAKQPAQLGMWYIGYYGEKSEISATIGAVVEGGSGSGSETPVEPPVEPPYDPELVELPEIPNMITADKNGYTPNRAFAVINGVHKNPKASYSLFADESNYAVAGNKYYVFLKYRVYSLAEGVSANISINGTTVLSTTETTDAWVQLLDADGKLYTFENIEVDDIIAFIFDLKGGAGCFAIADFFVANQKGEIVYSLANDKTMHIETDMRYVSNGLWKGDPYVADKNGPTLFPIQTKVETYKPTAYVSLTQDNKIKGSSAEAFLYFRTNNALFTAGQTYTIKGMFKSEVVCGYNGNANPLLKISDSTGAAQIVDIANHGTNGNWYPLLTPDGKPVTFKGTADEDWMKINLYCTYGTVALADIVITDAQGNVVYDMAADNELKAVAGQEITGNVADIGGPLLRHALYNNGHVDVWFADAAQSNTETSKQIPTFVEVADIPVEECDHDFVDGTCTKCGEADPDYIPECDHDFVDGTCTKCGEADPDYIPACDHDFVDGTCTKCGEADPDYIPACDHDFVDGTCTKCGEADPDYVPGGDDPIDPPAQTGDVNMIFVVALATFAVISLAALTLNKKKFNA